MAASAAHRARASQLVCYGAVSFGLLDLGLISLFQRNTEDGYRGRVFGAISTAEAATVVAGLAMRRASLARHHKAPIGGGRTVHAAAHPGG